jgi:DNA/RNA endonuclease G (NUC1)
VANAGGTYTFSAPNSILNMTFVEQTTDLFLFGNHTPTHTNNNRIRQPAASLLWCDAIVGSQSPFPAIVAANPQLPSPPNFAQIIAFTPWGQPSSTTPTDGDDTHTSYVEPYGACMSEDSQNAFYMIDRSSHTVHRLTISK